MNDINKIAKGVRLSADLLPLLILGLELIKQIREIYKETPEAFTPAMMDRLKGLIDLEQTVFD